MIRIRCARVNRTAQLSVKQELEALATSRPNLDRVHEEPCHPVHGLWLITIPSASDGHAPGRNRAGPSLEWQRLQEGADVVADSCARRSTSSGSQPRLRDWHLRR